MRRRGIGDSLAGVCLSEVGVARPGLKAGGLYLKVTHPEKTRGGAPDSPLMVDI